MSKVLDRIMEYTGKKRNQVSNPCITANEAIDLANSIDFIKGISEAKSRDMALITAENVRLQQEVLDLQAVIDEANAQEPFDFYEVAEEIESRNLDQPTWLGSSGISSYELYELLSKLKLYARPMPAQQSPRITEQDVQEVCELLNTVVDEDVFMRCESWYVRCRALLNKLNTKNGG